MKKFTFIFAGLALLASAAFTSCEKTPAPSADEGLKSIALSVNFGQTGTKAVIDGELDDPWTKGYSGFEWLDIYFTNANDQIKYYYRAASTDVEGTGKIIWDSLDPSTSNPNSGVRFIGMEGISKVFVVANGPKITGLHTDSNGTVTSETYISALNDAIKLTDYTGEQNTMLYAGAAVNLTLAGTVSETAGVITVGEEGGQDYQADVTIRPALSRLEVQQAGVVTSGYVYFKTDGDTGNFIETEIESEAEYRVEFRGFQPSLVGVYASNVYKTSPLFPVQIDPAAGTLFATPTFAGQESPIKEGKWVELVNETELNDYLSYANYNEAGTGYGDLVSGAYSDDTPSGTNELLLFNGNKNSANKVIPFNFFVPYDITSTASDVTALSGSVMPSLHFQFKEQPAQQSMTLTVTHRQTAGAGTWEPVTDNSITEALKAQVDWPTAVGGEDGIAFANVVKYFTSNAHNDETTLRPGYIYRVSKVIVDPTNISISTKDTDAYNVYVVVTVVPYNEENVFPGFE